MSQIQEQPAYLTSNCNDMLITLRMSPLTVPSQCFLSSINLTNLIYLCINPSCKTESIFESKENITEKYFHPIFKYSNPLCICKNTEGKSYEEKRQLHIVIDSDQQDDGKLLPKKLETVLPFTLMLPLYQPGGMRKENGWSM
jgi:hypothetical protein